MLASERQRIICEKLNKNGAVTVSELINKLNVSVETVRRDLLNLEKKGLLSRVHGGAIPKTHLKPAGGFAVRKGENRSLKYELSKTAVTLVENGDTIAVDAGTTAIEFAEVLKESFSELTVVTHSLGVFEILSENKNIKTILNGGVFERGERAFFGTLTTDAYERLHVSKAFIFPTAISISGGISDFNFELADVQRQIFKIADRVVILADSSKFEKASLVRLCDVSPEHIYVSDSKLPESIFELYKENNLTVLKG